MKQITKNKIKELEHAFHQGKKIMYYGKGYDFTLYEVTDVKKIKELVICDYCIRVYDEK